MSAQETDWEFVAAMLGGDIRRLEAERDAFRDVLIGLKLRMTRIGSARIPVDARTCGSWEPRTHLELRAFTIVADHFDCLIANKADEEAHS